MKSDEVEQWLKKILAMKYETPLSTLLQQLKWSSELGIFLHGLQTDLTATVRINGNGPCVFYCLLSRFLSLRPPTAKNPRHGHSVRVCPISNVKN